MVDRICDVAILGAGTAGLGALSKAREAGADTVLIDPAFKGTTCAHDGCMPSKLLIAASGAAHGARNAGTFGIRAGKVTVDGPAVMDRVRRLRDAFVAGVKEKAADLPDDVFLDAAARFRSPTLLDLDDGRTLEARAIVVATGAVPFVPPPFRDLGDRVLTHESLFALEDLPRSVAVIGAGAIGLELAQSLSRLGVRVAVFDRADRAANLPQDDLSETLCGILGAEFDIHLGVDPEATASEDGVRMQWEGGTETFEFLLAAAGRRPRTEGLGLEEAGIPLDEDGMPEADPYTGQVGGTPVFLAGDITGTRQVLHEASREGSIAGLNAAAFPKVKAYPRFAPFQMMFTHPNVVMLGRPDVRDGIVTADASYDDQGRARVMDLAAGTVRLYAQEGSGLLRGAVLIGPAMEHVGHLLAWAMDRHETAPEILSRPFYHPTIEEGLKPALRDLCSHCGLVPRDATEETDSPPGG